MAHEEIPGSPDAVAARAWLIEMGYEFTPEQLFKLYNKIKGIGEPFSVSTLERARKGGALQEFADSVNWITNPAPEPTPSPDPATEPAPDPEQTIAPYSSDGIAAQACLIDYGYGFSAEKVNKLRNLIEGGGETFCVKVLEKWFDNNSLTNFAIQNGGGGKGLKNRRSKRRRTKRRGSKRRRSKRRGSKRRGSKRGSSMRRRINKTRGH